MSDGANRTDRQFPANIKEVNSKGDGERREKRF